MRRDAVPRAGCLSALLLLGALISPAVQADDQAPQPLRVGLGVKGETVTASFDVTPTLLRTASFRRRLDGGLTGRVIIELFLLDGDDHQIAYAARACKLRLDIWDERLEVAIRDGELERTLRPFEDVARGLRACGELSGVDLADLSLLGRASGYRLQVLVSLNPVSPELLDRAREFLANPRGGRSGRPRPFFGAVSRLFSSSQSAGGDTFPFTSALLDRPSRGPR